MRSIEVAPEYVGDLLAPPELRFDSLERHLSEPVRERRRYRVVPREDRLRLRQVRKRPTDGLAGDRGGAVGGVGIDHEDLPDQPVLGQHLKLGHGCRDRPRRVPGRDHHTDRFPQLAADVGGGEVPVVEGV